MFPSPACNLAGDRTFFVRRENFLVDWLLSVWTIQGVPFIKTPWCLYSACGIGRSSICVWGRALRTPHNSGKHGRSIPVFAAPVRSPAL